MIFGATTVILALIVYNGIRVTQESAFDTSLYNHAVDVAGSIDLTILGDLVLRRDDFVEENKAFPFPLGRSVIQIRRMDGALLLSSAQLRNQPLPVPRGVFETIVEQGAAFSNARLFNENYRIVHYLIRRASIPPLILQVAVPTTVLESERRPVIPMFAGLIALSLAAAGVVGLITSTRALAPVFRIIDTAKAMKPGELSARVPVPQEGELRELALTLNDLLSRLERAFESQEKFIADASHQLKTPLAIIRGEIDVHRQKLASSDGEVALLTSVAQEVDQLSKMVDNLLLLARFDAGSVVPSFTRVRVDEILLEVISQLEKPASKKNVRIGFELRSTATTTTPGLVTSDSPQPTDNTLAEFEISGDADLLRILYFNLLENAIKYSPESSEVKIDLSESGSVLETRFSDQGPGIQPDEKERIFDRFYRGSRSQHRVPGVGLGLSIAYRIARLHSADLTVDSVPGQGAAFTLQIKKF